LERYSPGRLLISSSIGSRPLSTTNARK
jgi:hypothetical protein